MHFELAGVLAALEECEQVIFQRNPQQLEVVIRRSHDSKSNEIRLGLDPSSEVLFEESTIGREIQQALQRLRQGRD